MNTHTAEVLVKQVIFGLTYTSIAQHLCNNMPLSEFGINQVLIPKLSAGVGIKADSVTISMTFGELVERVVKESNLDVHIEKVSIIELLYS